MASVKITQNPNPPAAFQEVHQYRQRGCAAGRPLQGQDRGHRGRDRPEPRPHRRALLGGAEAGVPHQEPPPHSAQGQSEALKCFYRPVCVSAEEFLHYMLATAVQQTVAPSIWPKILLA